MSATLLPGLALSLTCLAVSAVLYLDGRAGGKWMPVVTIGMIGGAVLAASGFGGCS